MSSVIVRVSVVLKRTVGDSDWCFDNLSGRHLQCQWMVFMSLVIDQIGQLNCHVIGCKACKSWLVRFNASVVLVSLFARPAKFLLSPGEGTTQNIYFLQVFSLVASLVFKIQRLELSRFPPYVTSRRHRDKAVLFEKWSFLMIFSSLNS